LKAEKTQKEDPIQKLDKLVDLCKKGISIDEEFAKLKAKLIGILDFLENALPSADQLRFQN
jgi:fructose-bisphosphate aldolase class 1